MNRHCRYVAVALCLSLAATAQAGWIVEQLTPLPAWTGSVEATDINNHGVVCGSGNYVVNVSATPFVYDGVTITELPLLPAPTKPWALATAINDAGVICGYGYDDVGRLVAIKWENGVATTLPYPPDADVNSTYRAYDINNAGVIVGYHYSNLGDRAAFYYEDGVAYSLDAPIRAAGLLGGQIARGVSNANVICGSATDPNGIDTPWTYDIVSGTLTVIGVFTTEDCGATAINSAGQIVGRGQEYPWTNLAALMYDGGWAVVDPANTQSQWVKGLNEAGRVVGNSYIGSNNRESWYSDGPGAGSFVLLPISGWISVSVESINDNGWMTGYGRPPGGALDAQQAFIMRPPFGDVDHDADVDFTDAAALLAALSGPAGGPGFTPPTPVQLAAFDAPDADDDLDLADVMVFQTGYPVD